MSGSQVTEQTVQELRDLAQQTVELAKRAGADHAEVTVSDGSELTVKVRLGEIELLQQAGSRSLGLRVLRDGKRAVTSTSDLRREALELLCAETVTLAGFAEPDECALPPDPALLATSMPDLDLYDPAIAEVDVAYALRQAMAGEAAARGFDPRISNSEGATWTRSLGARALATSDGFVGAFRGSGATFWVEPLVDDASDPAAPTKRKSSYWTSSRFLGTLEDVEEIGREAARRAVAMIGSQKMETQECPIVFDPDVAVSIVGMVFSVANGGAFWRKSSYLVGREEQVIASPLVTITDDPHIPRALGSRPFDGDGLPTRKNPIVEAGVLRPVLCDVYAGRKLGRPSTGSRGIGGGSGPTTSNLVMQSGGMKREELLRSTERCLYVTGLMGFGFNPVTGDFSRGAQGFWMERGERVHPVNGVTIAASFDEILKRIDAVADDLKLRSSTAAPTFRVSHMMVAGTSR